MSEIPEVRIINKIKFKVEVLLTETLQDHFITC